MQNLRFSNIPVITFQYSPVLRIIANWNLFGYVHALTKYMVNRKTPYNATYFSYSVLHFALPKQYNESHSNYPDK